MALKTQHAFTCAEHTWHTYTPTTRCFNVQTQKQSKIHSTIHTVHISEHAFQVNSLTFHLFALFCSCAIALVVQSLHHFISVIICFSCRILFGTMTAPSLSSSSLSSSLFVHTNRCCFLLYFDLLCTQHETTTIASQSMPQMYNTQQMSTEQCPNQ